jgi:hypothetical protein
MRRFHTLSLCLLCLWLSFFLGAFDKDKPAASTSLRSSNPEILANWSAIEVALDQDHDFTTGGTQTGKHEVITLEEEASAGASSTNEGHLQVIDGGSQPELAFTSEDGDELQFTKDGDLYSSDNLVIDGTSTLTGAVGSGTITLTAGSDLIGSSTSDITINTNKFTVAGATGNTLIAGTAEITGTLTQTGVATFAVPPTWTQATVDNNTALNARNAADDGNEAIAIVDGSDDIAFYHDVDTTNTAVYTRYITGTLDSDSETDVPHLVTSGLTKILSCVAYAKNSGGFFQPNSVRDAQSASNEFRIKYDGTNVTFTSVGANI